MTTTDTTESTQTDESNPTNAPNPKEVLRPSDENYWITRGNGGTSRAIHRTDECPHLNQSGHCAADPREASDAEVNEAVEGDRGLCSAATCFDYRTKQTGRAEGLSAWDVRRMAREGEIE